MIARINDYRTLNQYKARQCPKKNLAGRLKVVLGVCIEFSKNDCKKSWKNDYC